MEGNTGVRMWNTMPEEIMDHIFSYLPFAVGSAINRRAYKAARPQRITYICNVDRYLMFDFLRAIVEKDHYHTMRQLAEGIIVARLNPRDFMCHAYKLSDMFRADNCSEVLLPYLDKYGINAWDILCEYDGDDDDRDQWDDDTVD